MGKTLKNRHHADTMDQRMFDFQAFYQRQAAELSNGCRIAEVGCADGASGIYLAEALLDERKDFKLYMIDNLAYGGALQMQSILTHLALARLLEVVEFLPFDSLTASTRFPDNFFDLVFLDSSHKYEPTKAEIRLWHQKVKDFGVLAGHDFNDGEGNEVKRAVSEVVPEHFTRPPLPDGQTFETESVLRIESTTKEWNVWWYQKMFYLKLN